MGRYVPPEHEGVTSGNRLHKSHHLGQRARKPGCLVVRFEMPFPIWCATCPRPTIIAQGVRFNAEKRKTGSYYSTPIYSFTIKHAACGGMIIIQTDPKNTEYEIVSGARRRDLGATEEEEGSIPTPREKEETRSTAISLLERTISDREKLFDANARIGELQDAVDKHWDDPYEQNRRLRNAFRVGRHEREKNTAAAQNLKERMSLGIELLAESEDDARRARLIDFGPEDAREEEKVLARPLFDTAAKEKTGRETKREKRGMLKSEVALRQMERKLVSEIVSNTRAARDPFLGFGSSPSALGPKGLLPGLKKRKRAIEDEAAREAPEPPLQKENEQEKEEPPAKTAAGPTVTALVSYDSDSE